MKKVLIISYYWPPSGGAGVQRTLKFARYLPEYGVQPVILTVDAEKASYPLRDESLSAEVDTKLEVHRTNSFEPLQILSSIAGKDKVPYGGFANPGKETFFQKSLRWIRGNFFIPDARVGWVNYAVKAAGKIIRENGIDTIYISSPPHSSQLIGLKLKKMHPHLKWIADLRDPWTEIYYYKDLLHTHVAAAKDAQLERSVIEQSNNILVVSDAIKRSFLRLVPGVAADKIVVLPNGYDESDFDANMRPENGVFRITYVGTMASSYHPEVFVEALKSIKNKFPLINIRFRFVGSAPGSFVELMEIAGLTSICEWISHVSHDEAVRYMQDAQLLLLVIPEVNGANGILTGKLFEYLGAGHPILGIGPVNGDAAKIVLDCEAGVFFERSHEREMIEWISDLINKFERGEVIQSTGKLHKKFQRRVLTGELAKLLLN